MIVYVIDDDSIISRSLEILLRGEGFETQIYASAEKFLATVNAKTRGCVVTDQQLPGLSGLDLMVALRERGVTLPVIVITGHANLPLAVEAMKKGASDFIQKPYSAGALLSAIRSACENAGEEGVESPHLAETRDNLAKLTARETEVLLKLISGSPSKLIAHDMGLSVRTVDSHRASVKKKMGGGSLAELMRKCIAVGLAGAQAGRERDASNLDETRAR
jgi:two-component system response regulator FixJ